MKYGENYGPTTFPGIVINNSTFRGQLETNHVFNAVCAGFHDLPKDCYKMYNVNELLEMNINVVRTKHLVLGCILVLLIVLTIMCFYRRHAKR